MLPSLDDDAVLSEDFSLDSVDLVGLLMQVESQFQVRLTNAELTENRTVGELIDHHAANLLSAHGTAGG